MTVSEFVRQKGAALGRLLPAFLIVVVCDQLTKWWILQTIPVSGDISVIPGFFDLVLTYNKGAAFGFLANAPDGWRHVLLGLTTLIALCAVLYFLLHDHYQDRIAQIALSMIIGGAVGNIIDRVRFGSVVDFLLVYYESYRWPAFNIADSAITIGVVLLLVRKGTGTEAAASLA